MSDEDLRLLERKHREGSATELDQARLFSALWKKGEADIFIFIMSCVYEEPNVRFEILTKTKPDDLKIPVVIGMSYIDWRPHHYQEGLTITAPGPLAHGPHERWTAPKKARPVEWHGAWNQSGSISTNGDKIRATTYETIFAVIRNRDVKLSREWIFYPAVVPAELSA